MSNNKKSWQSIYLYYSGSADLVLKDLVSLFLYHLKQALHEETRFFFIRYYEDGFHIRLRLYLSDPEKDIADNLLRKQLGDFDRKKKENTRIVYAPYTPEIDRYGNPQTIHLAEQQFEISSRSVLDWLQQQPNISSSARFLQAIKLHLAFFKGIGISMKRSLTICDQFIAGWLPRLYTKELPFIEQETFFTNLFESEFSKYKPHLEQTVGKYWKGLSETEDPIMVQYLHTHQQILFAYLAQSLEENQLNDILSSFLHMTNNRLGISNREEAFLLFLVKKSILLM